MPVVNYRNGLASYGVPVFGGGGIPPFTGNYYFVDPVKGNDGNKGTDAKRPFATLYAAHNKCTDGNNDVVFLIGNGQMSGSAILSLALAKTINSSATHGTLDWSKNATHLVGIAAPGRVAQRARISPPDSSVATSLAATFIGTGTAATSNTLVNVTGFGCMFANLSLFHGFYTGGAYQICWYDGGQRNFYSNVHFGGMGDAASAVTTTGRSLVIDGGTSQYGEHTFVGCTIGLDTVTRLTLVNASLELTGHTPRNSFVDCIFPFYTTLATTIGIKVGTGGIDRWQLFERCKFLNATKSAGTAMTALTTMAASAGGYLLFKDCSLVGITDFSTDATTDGQIFLDGAAPTGNSSGLAVASAIT